MRAGTPCGGGASDTARTTASSLIRATRRIGASAGARTSTAGTPAACRSAVQCATHTLADGEPIIPPPSSQHGASPPGLICIIGAPRSIAHAASATAPCVNPSRAIRQKAIGRMSRRFTIALGAIIYGGGRSLGPTRLCRKFPVTGKTTGEYRDFGHRFPPLLPRDARPEPISGHLSICSREIEQGFYVP